MGLLSLLALRGAAAFSTFAGSCKHAGVNHGLDKFAAQEGAGGHVLSLSHPGVNVPGAAVTLTLSGASEYKGLLLLAEMDGAAVAAWGGELPEGVQRHPHCKHGLTHDTYHVGGKLRDDVPWMVPEGLAPGAEVVFKATVVRDYATWRVCRTRGRLDALSRGASPRFAFERTYVVGSEDGAGGAPVLVAEESAQTDREDSEGDAEVQLASEAAATQQMDMDAFRTRQRRLRLAHAGLMIVAWLVAAPAGALAARYLKHLGALWFDAHRMLQGAAVVATFFGAAIALGILHPSLLNLGVHGTLGVAVVVLSCLQPLNAIFRPGKTAGKPRAAWKRLHAALGWFTIAAGAFNCLVGVQEMTEKEGDARAPWYCVLILAAAIPCVGAAVVSSQRRSSVLPFSFATKSTKSSL